MHNALKQNNNLFSRYYLNEDFNEIKFDFELVDDIIVGENFRFDLSYFTLTLVCTTTYQLPIVSVLVHFKRKQGCCLEEGAAVQGVFL